MSVTHQEMKVAFPKIRDYIKPEDFEGRTIQKIDCSSVNCTTFYFTDGTSQTLEAELIFSSLNLYGIVQR